MLEEDINLVLRLYQEFVHFDRLLVQFLYLVVLLLYELLQLLFGEPDLLFKGFL